MATASALLAARRDGRALPDFPGPLAGDLDAAYALQAAQMALRGGEIGGWKVALIRPEFRDRYPAERLIGPVFADTIVETAGDIVEVGVITGGFAAVEAEFAVRMARDLPARPEPYTAAEIAAAAGALHIAVEIAGSPVAALNALGPGANIPDLGGNAGLVVGPTVPGGLATPPDQLTAAVTIEGVEVGRGSAAALPGGPLAALAFCVEALRRRGRGLMAGDLISTGATTGVHDVRPGQRATLAFPGHGTIDVRIVAASAPARAG